MLSYVRGDSKTTTKVKYETNEPWYAVVRRLPPPPLLELLELYTSPSHRTSLACATVGMGWRERTPWVEGLLGASLGLVD